MEHFTALANLNGNSKTISCLVKRGNVRKDRCGNRFYIFTALVAYDMDELDSLGVPVSIKADSPEFSRETVRRLFEKYFEERYNWLDKKPTFNFICRTIF